MQKTKSGFTIVELLIVIIVIAILASITVVAYTNIRNRALNSARTLEVTQWRNVFDMYFAFTGDVPGTEGTYYCLGSGFPDGKCRDYQMDNHNTYLESDNADLMADLRSSTGSLPSGPREPVNGTVGPYVMIWSSTPGITITHTFNGTSSDCPSTMDYGWDDGNGRLLCYIDIPYW